MACPKCPRSQPGELIQITIDDVQVERCAACGGMWFDKGELGALLNRETARINPLLGGTDPEDLNYKTGRCPRDGKKMLRVLSARNRQVVIESCSTCQGIWLDGGEFERIKRASPNVKLGDLV